MRAAAVVTIILLSALAAPAPASAHRLDEYLQDTTVDVGKDRIALQVRLTPGVQVLPTVLPAIDTDGDGTISDVEQRAYAERVLRDLSLTFDGDHVPLRLTSSAFPPIEDMREGVGEILLGIEAAVPPRGTSDRKLVLENRHQPAVSVYLVNCLAPSDPDIRVLAQHRNYEQSFYQLDYTQAGVARGLNPVPAASRSTMRGWLIMDGIALLALLGFFWQRGRRRANGSSQLAVQRDSLL